jgi:hypothetical protein
VTPSEIKAAREKYNYVPARLIRAGNYVTADLTWKSLNLIIDVPTGWDVAINKHDHTIHQGGVAFDGPMPSATRKPNVAKDWVFPMSDSPLKPLNAIPKVTAH